MKIKNNKFKIISALSVFYDLKKPNSFLHDVEKILDDQGVFLLEFADLASIIKFNMFDTFCHEHLEYYSSKIIYSMCKKNNLRIFDAKLNNINGGSVQYFICKQNAKYKENTISLKKIFVRESKLRLSEIITYKRFINRVDKIKSQLLKFINNVKKQNKKIHVYGASTKGNVLLQYFGINNKHIDFAVERNPKKYNLYTPGTKIKIISEKKSRKIAPDYYLVLPWHFKNEILKRERFTIKKGSKFIFPLPKLSINS